MLAVPVTVRVAGDAPTRVKCPTSSSRNEATLPFVLPDLGERWPSRLVATAAEDRPAMQKLLLAGVAALFLTTGVAHAKKMTSIEPALPPHFSGVWCYRKIASEEAIKPVSIYERGEDINDCANRGGFTIWPNGRGYTFGRFNVVRNSCKFEKVDLIKSSGKRRNV